MTIHNKISQKEASELKARFLDIEIIEALNDIDPNNSPGPDGFNGFYIRAFWEFIKTDIKIFLEKFQDSGEIPQGLNVSFIALIPKIESPLKVQDFRPISFINCTFKILFKVMAKRLKRTMNTLVSEAQFKFIKGRYITDCTLIVGKVTHSIQHNLAKGVIFKVDFESLTR